MNFKDLLESKKIESFKEKGKPNFEYSERDLNVSKDNFLSGNFDWALNIAYNSVLLAGRELMFSFGFRPIGKEHHKNVFEFLREVELNQELVEFFDKVRKKRNKIVYGLIDDVSEEFVEEVIEKAEEFVQEIRTFVQKNRTEVEE